MEVIAAHMHFAHTHITLHIFQIPRLLRAFSLCRGLMSMCKSHFPAFCHACLYVYGAGSSDRILQTVMVPSSRACSCSQGQICKLFLAARQSTACILQKQLNSIGVPSVSDVVAELDREKLD